DLAAEVRPRRAGDPARVVASPARIAKELDFCARFGVADMVASAWEGWSHSRKTGRTMA
ncbi:MAG: UDP-glucose 4-epimerase GalE, partial [Streptomycetaceae bacterium]|nr:UDP-glucose 4-epimerase GalE [Streptomycetaceae bacterium]